MSLAKHLRSITDEFHGTRVERMVPDMYKRIVDMAHDYAKLGFDRVNYKNSDLRFSDVMDALMKRLVADGFMVEPDNRSDVICVRW